jgi:hypothetical protein
MRLLLLLLLLAMPLVNRAAITDQPVQSGAASIYDELQSTCKVLLDKGMQGNITTLSKFYAATSNAPIREALTAATSLYWMLRQQIGESDKYAEHLQKNFPNSMYHSLVDKSANLITCTNCQNGIGSIPCADCGGNGKCRSCGGRGKVAGMMAGGATFSAAPSPAGGAARPAGGALRPAGGGGGGITRLGDPVTPSRRADLTSTPQQACAVCEGSGTCKRCKGTKLGQGKCPFCQGLKSIFVQPRTMLAYIDIVTHLRNLALAASMAERGKIRLDGRWYEAAAANRLLQQREKEAADFARGATEAEYVTNYPAALQLLDATIQHYPTSTYTGDVLRIRELMLIDAADSKLSPKVIQGPAIMEAIQNNPAFDIRGVLNAVLTACRRGTNAPLLLADNTKLSLPEDPLRWQIGEPTLIGRAARVPATIDRPSRTGFTITEAWEFRLIYNRNQWQVWQAAAP